MGNVSDEMMAKMPDLIAGEAADAMKYANLALANQAEHPDLADMFMQLSAEELAHMRMISEKLASMVGKLHDQYKGA